MKRTATRLILASSISVACAPTHPAATAPCTAPAPDVTTPVTTAPVPQAAAASAKTVEVPAAIAVAVITVANPASIARRAETVVIGRDSIEKLSPAFDFKKALIFDASGTPLLSQIVDDNGDGTLDAILFQADLASGEKKTFQLRVGERRLAAPSDYKVYGRFVRERHDDFAWENDLVAHRVYGPDLETTPKEPLISSGIDTWAKRVAKLIINEWYLTDDYHEDSGEGADFYGVAKSRGCGGLGIWSDGKLATSKNFTMSRVLANGPIRLAFELTYAPWQLGKAERVSETKRVTLDAGSQFNLFESTFTGGAKAAMLAGVGIAKHQGSVVQFEAKSSSLRVWEPLHGPKGGESGNLGCAIVFAPDAKLEQHDDDLNYLVTTAVPASGKLSYYAGSAWDRAGKIRDAAAWATEVERQAARFAAPVTVTLSAAK
jgi:hypothetical protein